MRSPKIQFVQYNHWQVQIEFEYLLLLCVLVSYDYNSQTIVTMKTIQKAFKFRLKAKKAQWTLIAQAAGCARWIYNYALERYTKSSKEKIYLRYEDIANQLPGLKRDPQTEWLSKPPAQILQQAIKDAIRAKDSFFREKKKNKKYGFPKFRRKFKHDSFKYPQHVKVDHDKVFLPKIGWVKFIDSRPIEGTIKQAVIKREGDHWYVSLVCEVQQEIEVVKPRAERVIGIDVGLLSFATLSNGEEISNPRYLKNSLTKLKHLQKKLARTKRGSKGRLKLKEKIRRLHFHIKNQRLDFLHKVTTQLVKNFDGIVIEDLHIRGMIKNRHLALAISDVGWGKFFSMLAYKCQWYGKVLVVINRFLPTSKTCSCCGEKQDMPLNERTYSCSKCGLEIDRDLNAALNIREAGLSFLQDQACKQLVESGHWSAR